MTIPCGKKAEKIGTQSNKSIQLAYQKRVAYHPHYAKVIDEDIGPAKGCVSKIQVQDVVEQQLDQEEQNKKQRQDDCPPFTFS